MQQSISWAIKWARLWSKVRLAELAAHTLQHSVILTSQFACRAPAADAALCMIALSRMQTLIHAWRVRHGFSFDRRLPQGGHKKEAPSGQ
jgi:hypothetical protein